MHFPVPAVLTEFLIMAILESDDSMVMKFVRPLS